VVKKRIKMIGRRPNEKGFKKELQCLELLRCLRHKNIIELLASYEQLGEFFLLFPKLDMDLSAFLKRPDRFAEFKDSITFYKALSGLASAIETVHNLAFESENVIVSRIGHHHDIRAKNILVTSNTFILTDFGLSRLKMPEEGSQTQWISTIGDYIAPECMNQKLENLPVGRSIDIWALGCLIADVATYMELGCDGVREHRKRRFETQEHKSLMSYRFFEGDALREATIEWLNAMSHERDLKEEGVTCLRDIVALCLQVDEQKRPKAAEVSRRLQYVNVKMMYRQIINVLDPYSLALDTQDELSPFQRLDAWFDVGKIKAWGRILGMETDRTAHELYSEQPEVSAGLTDTIEEFRQKICVRMGALQNTPGESDDVGSVAQEDNFGHLSRLAKTLAIRLWECVPLVYQMRLEQSWKHASSAMIDDVRLNIIEENVQVVPTTYSDIAKQATLSRLTKKFWEEGEKSDPAQRRLLIRDSEVEREKNLSEFHGIGLLDRSSSREAEGEVTTEQGRKRVFIEWMLYTPTWEKQSDEEKLLKILGLGEILSQAKPTNFYVLDCIGVIPPNKELNHPSFGLVYQYPNSESESPECEVVTLTGLMRRKDLPVLLEYKFSIARRICSSIYELHCSEWLHKNICANNILFFMTPEGEGKPLSQDSFDPYLVGFYHSRPEGDVYQSDNDPYNSEQYNYRHPSYIPGEVSFEKEFDYFSIGVLLFEIGFWEPIATFRTHHRTLSKTEFRDELVTRYLPKLGVKMGSAYMNAVRVCLNGLSRQSTHGSDQGLITDAFFWSVVAILSELKIS
jgi:serine/threonine protein kinase